MSDKELMDEVLSIGHSISSITNKKEELKIKYLSKLNYGYNNGVFKIDNNLILYIKMLLDQDIKQKVLLDYYEEPILINQLDDFYYKIVERYNNILDEYYKEFQTTSIMKKLMLDNE